MDHGEMEVLGDLGLKTAVAHRRVRSGRGIKEVVFSRFDTYLDMYLRKFDGTPIGRSTQARRAEGFLFGYPSCCVEHFIEKGYTPNGLSPEDRRILFHWACPGCRVTPLLLPKYRELYYRCQAFFAEVSTQDSSQGRRLFKQGIAVAASLALLASGPGVVVPKATAQHVYQRRVVPPSFVSDLLHDPHLIPLPPESDSDQDYLTDDEELHLGTDPNNSDTDGDGVPDGVQWAKEVWEIIQELPTELSDTEPYRVDHLMFGLETCEKCGQTVNMGFVEIINPDLGLSVGIPYVGLHFMEYGGFSYAGDIHTGRVNLPLLNTVLKSERDPHWLLVEGDADHDGLTDDEEPRFETDPDNPDTDADGSYDGVELASNMHEIISDLPKSENTTETYLIEHFSWGHELCEICGESTNMGYVEIVNPLEGLSIEIPCIGLHYMEHGSFAYSGSIHQGRADLRLLDTVLRSDGTAHLLPVEGDSDHDGLTDDEETHFGTDAANPDTDGDGVLDGVGLAKSMWSSITELDTTASESAPYLIEHMMRGVVMCPVCGTWVNMGYVEVVNVPEDIRVEIPYLGLHFMEHGSFAYGPNPEERVDPIQTANALNEPMKGDINGDGKIDVTDVISLVNFILGTAEPTPAQFWAADFNGDGELNVLDVILMVRAII